MKKSLWMFSMAYLSRQNRVSKLLRSRKKKEWRKIGRAKEICTIPPSIPPNWNARKGGKRGRKDIWKINGLKLPILDRRHESKHRRTQQIPRSINTKRYILRQTVERQRQREILKIPRERKFIIYKEFLIRLKNNHQKPWSPESTGITYLKCGKEKKITINITYLANYSSKMEKLRHSQKNKSWGYLSLGGLPTGNIKGSTSGWNERILDNRMKPYEEQTLFR